MNKDIQSDHPFWGNIKIKTLPSGKTIRHIKNPDNIYSEHPAWKFEYCDEQYWKLREHKLFWEKIYNTLIAFERQTWKTILIDGKKQNHTINPDCLNKIARKRLDELKIEVDSIYSLRATGKIRIYGYFTGKYFSILWIDDNHGNNDNCVCKSNLKHT